MINALMLRSRLKYLLVKFQEEAFVIIIIIILLLKEFDLFVIFVHCNFMFLIATLDILS